MHFQLKIDKEKPELVLVRAHCRSELVNQLEALVTKGVEEDQLTGYTEDDLRILRFAEIQCITVDDGHAVAVVNENEIYRLKQRLYELEEMLPQSFIRISKSALANEKHLVRFTTGFSGAVDAVFRCGWKESVSRRCFAEIKRRVNGK